MRRLQPDWYSPTRLLSSPIQYDFPGDRFIPSRSLMDLDHAHSLLTDATGTQLAPNPKFNEEYRRKVEENLALDSEGRPFRMLVFRGSPKPNRKSIRLIDEMQQVEAQTLNQQSAKQCRRSLPKSPARILDAPRIRNDFYSSIMHWGKNNILAVALYSDVYLWSSTNQSIHRLLHVEEDGNYPASVAWSMDARFVAVGLEHSPLQVWDAETSKLVRNLNGHKGRVGTIAWSNHILTSGSKDKSVINHDVRARNSLSCQIRAHTQEVCGLKWSSSGSKLATSGNDNGICIWEASKMSTSQCLYRFREHRAAVKALAWCPYDSNVLASGGGTSDGCIKLWDMQKGTCISSTSTGAQVCGLEWNKHHKEIMSGHGYGTTELQNRLCLWRYPVMVKTGELSGHSSRILHLTQSADGLTVVSAGADETLRFWDVFGPPKKEDTWVSELDGHLSLKTSPIR